MYNRSLPREGQKGFKSLRDFTDEELIYYINNNETTDFSRLTGAMSEILRRMNEKNPILPKKDQTDLANPITP